MKAKIKIHGFASEVASLFKPVEDEGMSKSEARQVAIRKLIMALKEDQTSAADEALSTWLDIGRDDQEPSEPAEVA